MTGNDVANDLSLCVFPPNKPLEAKIDFSTTPVIYNHLMFIDFNKKGQCILGSSNVAATLWEGTLLFFNDADKLQGFDYSGHYIYATTTDGKFLNDTTIALAEDTGVLTILNVTEDGKLQPVNYYRHIEKIGELAVWESASKILSCSGKSLSIWDINTADRKPYLKYDNYHLSTITTVDTLKNDQHLFLTGSSDRKCCIWDTRAEIPVSILYGNEFSSITNVKWHQKNTNYIVCGTKAGDIYLLDKREPKDFLAVHHCYDDAIYKIDLTDTNKIAVCGDSNEVLVLSSEKGSLKRVIKHVDHQNYVRGVKWHDNSLYTCGFDRKIVKTSVRV